MYCACCVRFASGSLCPCLENGGHLGGVSFWLGVEEFAIEMSKGVR